MSGTITIVSGLPRSGTSLMMRMLEAGGMPILTDHIRQPDEDNPNGYYELEAVKQSSRNTSWMLDAPGKAVKMVYRLLRDLPADYAYQVIFMERRLEEVLSSQRVMLERRGEARDISDDARLAEFFRRDLLRIKQWLGDQPHFSVLYLSYNDILADPQGAIAAVNRFLGAQLDPQAMIGVVDPALYRQRR
ncbi:MAG: sulfotransferase domain-containing protein [Roseiflexaceae bacterium]